LSRVLLTGASGFVGRQALTALSDAGHEVHALARRRGADAPGVIWHELDLLAGCAVVAEVEPEILVHLAWYSEHGRFWAAPENLSWVGASLELLRAFADAGGRRVVMAGTCAEYEWSRERYREDAPLVPSTLYGTAKRSLYTLAAAYCEQTGIELAWGRLFFLYGPFEASARFVPSIVVALLRGEPAPMTAGTHRRDFLHTADAGAAFAEIARSNLVGPVNVASGEALELRAIARTVAKRIGREELLEIGARPQREGEPAALIADVQRLRENVGWTPKISLEDGIAEVIAWWHDRLTVGGEGAGAQRS
jgi:nucleoside-diphosphate-sugar epimerase